MNILICAGSYRKNGNTDQIIQLIEEHLNRLADQNQVSLKIETLYLGHLNLQPCRGCRACFDRGEDKCPLKDDLPMIKARMQAADGILVASPVYVDDVSGITKTWIDRLAHVCHRPEFAGKCAYLIATVGSSPTGHTLGTMKMALRTWGFHIVGQSGFKMGGFMKREETRVRFTSQADKAAQALFSAILERRYARPSFYALMTFKIQQRFWQKAAQDTIDYQYWKGRGWVENERDFYIPYQANRLKVALARLTGAVLAKFVA